MDQIYNGEVAVCHLDDQRPQDGNPCLPPVVLMPDLARRIHPRIMQVKLSMKLLSKSHLGHILCAETAILH